MFGALMVAATIGVAGCGGDDGDAASTTATSAASSSAADAELIAAAKEEDAVNFYYAQDPDRAQATIDAFTEKYGIDVEWLRLSGTQLTQRYMADVQAGTVPDAIGTGTPAFYAEGAEQGLFEQLTADVEPEFANWPKEATLFDDTTILLSSSPRQVVYNTERVPEEEAPTTWEDIVDSTFKDEIIQVDPRIVPTELGLWQVLHDEYGPEFLERFADQNAVTVESGVPGAQSLAAGEKKLMVATSASVVQPLIDDGAPLAMVQIEPVNGAEVMMAISKDAEHPNAARLLANFMMSEEGQEVANAGDKVSPLGVEGSLPKPEGYVAVDLIEADRNKDQLFELLGLQ